MANKVEVVIGTYEEYLLGYKVGYSKNGKQSLTQSFATRSHTGSVRCVAVSGKYMASGGADDRIFLYDMLSRKEIQVLIHHEGTVNTLAFTPDATHLLSGGDDGKIVAVRTNTWQVEAIWKKAHSGAAVTNITCHPSGKLALSLGSDITLRTWNLIKGRLAYTTNLKSIESLGKTPDCIAWSPCGNYFTLTGTRVVQIWGIKSAAMIKEQICDSKPTSVCWLTNSKVVAGLEDGKLLLIGVQDKGDPVLFTAHKQRVKAISYVNDILATVSSSGDLTLWTIDIKHKKLNQICSINIGCRPTCIALLDLVQFDDDYILKKEAIDTAEKICTEVSNQNRPLQTGTVVIEYDDDDKPIATIKSKASKASEECTKPVKKGKFISPKPDKAVEKGNKSKTDEWVETSVEERIRRPSETPDADPKRSKSPITNKNGEHEEMLNNLNFISKSKVCENKRKVTTDFEDDKGRQEKTVKPQVYLKSPQGTEVKMKSEFKKLSVELKRPPKTRGRKKVNYLTKTELKQEDKPDSDVTLSCGEDDMPQLKRESMKSDSPNSDDSFEESPRKKKNKFETPKSRPLIKGQRVRK